MQGRNGLAILIDEADCIGLNRPLLQMLRNVFQRSEGASLVLAGTDAVFPLLSEVFSPIPRQFHRIDVTPFRNLSDTLVLTQPPELIEMQDITPGYREVAELHKICGGDPSELQLYCHHMYALVESHVTQRMSLHPEVFHRVLNEYKGMRSPQADDIISAIERLPDRLLCDSPWLQRQNVTLEENIILRLVERALGGEDIETPNGPTAQEVRDAYLELFNIGLTTFEDRLRLREEPLAAGFWKSYVEVAKKKRWSWNGDSFARELLSLIVKQMGEDISSPDTIEEGNVDDVAMPRILGRIAAGESFDEEAIDDLRHFISDLIASVTKKSRRAIRFELSVSAGSAEESQLFYHFYLGEQPLKAKAEVEGWVAERALLLEEMGVSLRLGHTSSWDIPSAALVKVDEKLEAEKGILGVAYELEKSFEEVRKHPSGQALFRKGDLQGAAEAFRSEMELSYSPLAENNLAYCLILLGERETAFTHLTNAVSNGRDPIIGNNIGVVSALRGDLSAAKAWFVDALDWFARMGAPARRKVPLCMMVLTHDCRSVQSVDELPTDAALIINAVIVGGWARDKGCRELEARYPGKKALQWLPWLPK